MKKLLAILILGGAMCAPAFAGGSVTMLVGWVMPDGDSDIYQQNARETTFRTSDLNYLGTTIRYDGFVGNYLNVSGGFSYYGHDTTVQEIDFVHLDGSPIFRNIRLEVVPLEVGLQVLPAGRNGPIIPYVGGGFGLYYWEYEEVGDFVMDRNGPGPHVVTGSAYSDGWDPGYYIQAGVHVPVSRYLTLVGEAKYWKADGKLDVYGFDPSFEPLDLSGKQFSGGFSIWF